MRARPCDVIRRGIDAVERNDPARLEVDEGKTLRRRFTSQHEVIVPDREPNRLQAQIVLIRPEPGHTGCSPEAAPLKCRAMMAACSSAFCTDSMRTRAPSANADSCSAQSPRAKTSGRLVRQFASMATPLPPSSAGRDQRTDCGRDADAHDHHLRGQCFSIQQPDAADAPVGAFDPLDVRAEPHVDTARSMLGFVKP